MNSSDFKRICLGLAASVGILIVLDILASLMVHAGVTEQAATSSPFELAVKAAISMFVAAFAGAYVARVGFIGAAVLLTLGIWLFLVYTVNSTAAVAGQSDLSGVALQNGLSLLLGLTGAVAGAWLGRRFSRRGGSNVANAA